MNYSIEDMERIRLLRIMLYRVTRKFPNVDREDINKSFVLSYLNQNNLDYKNTFYIKEYVKDVEDREIHKYISGSNPLKYINDLIMILNHKTKTKSQKNYKVVYTPQHIRNYIIKNTIKGESIPRVIDPCCKSGAFLVFAAKYMHDKYKTSYEDIYNNYLYGCDLKPENIEKCRVFLELLMLESGEEVCKCNYSLHNGDALFLLNNTILQNRFDVVLGALPYKTSRKIDDKTRDIILTWQTANKNCDLFVPFYEMSFKLLNDKGVLGFFSPNTYLNRNYARELRDFMRDSKAKIEIVNFDIDVPMDGVSRYTCITTMEKGAKRSSVKYSLFYDSLDNLEFNKYSIYKYEDGRIWDFTTKAVAEVLTQMSKMPCKMADYHIRYGFQTPLNKFFVFKPLREDGKYYYREYAGREYKIEKEACMNIIKPNALINTENVDETIGKIIYPYEGTIPLSEPAFELKFPKTYKMFLEHKQDLLNNRPDTKLGVRDWYTFGKLQIDTSKYKTKLYIPYMTQEGIAFFSSVENLLHYYGYAILNEDIMELKKIKLFIETDVFKIYLHTSGRSYSHGYRAITKRFLSKFTFPKISDEEYDRLVKLDNDKRQKEIAKLYEINWEDIEKCKKLF